MYKRQDGDFIYACMWETSDNSMESFLVRIDPTAGTCEKMFSMDSTWIKGVVRDKMLLKSTSGDNSEWFTYDPVTGEQTGLLYTSPPESYCLQLRLGHPL